MLVEFSRGTLSYLNRCLACGFVLGAAVSSCEPDWRDLTSETDRAPRAGVGGSGTGGASGSASGGCSGDGCSKAGEASQGGSVAAMTDAGTGGTGIVDMNAGGGGEGGGGAAGEGGGGPVDDGAVDLPGTATADSEETAKNNLAANGHDGDDATKWVAADGQLGHYWTLDLESVHPLARIKIKWEYPHGMLAVSYQYTVGVSDDGVTYEVVVDKRANEEITQEQVALMPAGTRGRFVRVTVTGLPGPPPPNQEYWASFYEARVFGYSDKL